MDPFSADSAFVAYDDVTSDDVTASAIPPDADELPSGDVDSCNLYNFIVCTIIIGLICLFGLTGNVTSFIVLYKHKTETAAIFLLQCMAVFDSLLLVVSVIIYTLPWVYPYTGRLQTVHDSFDYIVLYVDRCFSLI
jgi:hypothetical protein